MAASYPAYFNERIETMPRDELAALQEARLLQMLPFACERAPLIRQTWEQAGVSARDIRSLDDFRNLAPFIDKDALRGFRDRYDDACVGLRGVDDDEIWGVVTTSGTTGDPTPFLRGSRIPQELTLMREFWHIGARPGDVLANLGFTFRTGTQGKIYGESGLTSLMFNHDPAELPRFFEGSRRYRPSVLFLLSHPLMGAIEELLEKTGEDPVDIFKSYKGVCFGGEPLGPRQAGLLKSWGVEVFEYGPMGDITGGMTCRAHDGFHAWEDIVLLECLDPDGNQPVREGEVGELVVTSIMDRFQPLIRFRTDDLVTTTTAKCACGRTHMRYSILGRKGDQLIVAGRRMLPRQVQDVVETVRETRAGLFQIVKAAQTVEVLRVRVGYDAAAAARDASAIRDELTDRLVAAFEMETLVELVLNEELLKLGPPHKIPRVTKA